jgi:hypothetical protein
MALSAQSAGSRTQPQTQQSQQTMQGPWTQEQKLTQYNTAFNNLTSLYNKRTAYNKYFITLLFVQAFVPVFVAVLGASPLSLSSDNLQVLIRLVFITAAAVSFTWGLKLISLHYAIASWRIAVCRMEKDASFTPFDPVQRSTDTMEAMMQCKFLETMTALPKCAQEEQDPQPRTHLRSHWLFLNWYIRGLSDYFLPFALAFIFVVIAVLFGRGALSSLRF